MTADLLIDARSPDIRRRSGIVAPDPFPYLRVGSTDTVFFDAREYGIQLERLEALQNGVLIEQIEPYADAGRALTVEGSPLQKTVLAILRAKGIDALRVSPDLPYAWALFFERNGIPLSVYDFAAERVCKADAEIARMVAAQRVTEGAFTLAKSILADAVIDGDRMRYRGEILTSEFLKAEFKTYFLRHGYSCPEGIIVASGDQTARPHDEGSGPLLARVPIIIDMFPRHDDSGYFADMTRTFVKGEPTPEVRALCEAVRDVQAEIAAGVKAGDTGDAVYRRTVDAFAKRGYETSSNKGFVHGTGHGLGLAVHESPGLRPGSVDVLRPGMAVTVEPGLYYPGIGGARVEDVIVFRADGSPENITQFDNDCFIP